MSGRRGRLALLLAAVAAMAGCTGPATEPADGGVGTESSQIREMRPKTLEQEPAPQEWEQEQEPYQSEPVEEPPIEEPPAEYPPPAPAPDAAEFPGLPPLEELLVGTTWQEPPVEEAGFAGRYLFEEDGRYLYCGPFAPGHVIYSTGDWWLEDGMLCLTASILLQWRRGTPEPVRDDWSDEPLVIEHYPLTILEWNSADGSCQLLLDGGLVAEPDITLVSATVQVEDLYDFRDDNEAHRALVQEWLTAFA